MSHLNLIVDMWVPSLVNSLFGKNLQSGVIYLCFLGMPPKATPTRATRSSGTSLGKILPVMSLPAKRGPKGKRNGWMRRCRRGARDVAVCHRDSKSFLSFGWNLSSRFWVYKRNSHYLLGATLSQRSRFSSYLLVGTWPMDLD